jgi:hypothetical protein
MSAQKMECRYRGHDVESGMPVGNIRIVLQKEWLEFKQQRALLLSIIFVPLLLTLIPLVALDAIGHTPPRGNADEISAAAARATPALAGMSQAELAQAIMGQAFSSMFLLLPMLAISRASRLPKSWLAMPDWARGSMTAARPIATRASPNKAGASYAL